MTPPDRHQTRRPEPASAPDRTRPERTSRLSRLPWIATLVLLAGLILLSRAPQLVGDRLLPDGDEALVAVMANQALHGEQTPLFLWGQRYGLAAPEVLALEIGFKSFGESPRVQRAAVLVLWAAGVLLLATAVRRLGRRRQGPWVGALLIACPGWLAASTKAWGTMVTGFFFTSVALYALSALVRTTVPSDPSDLTSAPAGSPPVTRQRRDAMAAVTGLAAALAACANPFWFVFLAPVVGILSWRRVSRRDLAAAALGGVVAASMILAAFLRTPAYWEPSLFEHANPLQALLLLPGRLNVALTGTYFLMAPTPAGPATALLGMLWMFGTAVVLVRSGWRIGHHRAPPVEKAVAWALVATLAVTLAIGPDHFSYRYLLPAVSASVILLGLNLGAMTSRVDQGFGFVLVAALLFVAPEFGHVSSEGYDSADRHETTVALDGLLAFLHRQGISNVYSTDPMLPWNVMLASSGAVTARWTDSTDRHPAFPQQVDCALARGSRTALVGRVDPNDPVGPPGAEIFADQFFALPDVARGDLVRMGFGIGTCKGRLSGE